MMQSDSFGSCWPAKRLWEYWHPEMQPAVDHRAGRRILTIKKFSNDPNDIEWLRSCQIKGIPIYIDFLENPPGVWYTTASSLKDSSRLANRYDNAIFQNSDSICRHPELRGSPKYTYCTCINYGKIERVCIERPVYPDGLFSTIWHVLHPPPVETAGDRLG